jgi:hypothetical protein
VFIGNDAFLTDTEDAFWGYFDTEVGDVVGLPVAESCDDWFFVVGEYLVYAGQQLYFELVRGLLDDFSPKGQEIALGVHEEWARRQLHGVCVRDEVLYSTSFSRKRRVVAYWPIARAVM